MKLIIIMGIVNTLINILKSSALSLVVGILIVQFSVGAYAQNYNDKGFPQNVYEFVKVEFKLPQYKKSIRSMFDTAQGLSKAGRFFRSKQSRQNLWNQYSEVHQKKIQPTFKKLGKSTMNEAGHLGQTVLLLFMISVIESINQEVKIADLSKQELSSSEFFDIVTRQSSETIERWDILAGMAGATGTGIAIQSGSWAVQKTFGSIVSKQTSKSAFLKLTRSGIVALLMFVGWEAISQLAIEARNMIVDDADYELAQYLFATPWNTHRRDAVCGDPQYQTLTCDEVDQMMASDQARVRQLMFTNMGIILFQNTTLLQQWLYNSWRLRIASGDFVTLFLGMTAGSVVGGVIGSALFPGAGTLVGLVFGIAGGLLGYGLYKIVPDTWKDKITHKIKWARRQFSQMDMDRDLYMILPYLISDRAQKSDGWDQWSDQLWMWGVEGVREDFLAENQNKSSFDIIEQTLENRRELREQILNTYFELIYAYLSQMQLAEMENQIAMQALELKDDKALTDYLSVIYDQQTELSVSAIREIVQKNQQLMKEAQDQLNSLRYEPMALYATEANNFLKILELNCDDVNCGNGLLEVEELILIETHIKQCHFLAQMLKFQYHGILPAQSGYMKHVASAEEKQFIEHSVMAIIETANFRGFKEREALEYYYEF